MSNLIRNGRPNVIRGGSAKQFAPGLFYMKGRTHAAGGIDIGKNPKTGVEVEDGEVVQLNKNGMRVFSAMSFLTGESPASLVANGADPDVVFAAQENFKNRFGINDDGTMKAKWGKELRKRWHNTIDPTQGYPTGVSDFIKNVLRGAVSLFPFYSPRFRVNPNDKVADAAWAKRLDIDYNEEDLPSNDDGSVRLPKQIELEIPTDTTMLKNRIKANEKLAETLYGDDWRAVNNLIDIDKKALEGLRHTYKTGEPVVINEFSHNSRNMYKNGKVDIKETPLNVLQNFTIQYDKNNNRMNYKDIYDFNQYEWFVPGKPFDIKGYIDLSKKKMGGIHIDKNKRGTFTAAATKHGMSVQEFASRVLANKEDYSPAMVKKANFAKNASRWKKPAGGVISINGNVKNGLVYTGRVKAQPGGFYPIIRTKNGYITSSRYAPVDNKIDIYNGQQVEKPQYKIEGQGPVRSLVRGIPIKLDNGRGFYTVTDRPAERVLGLKDFDNLMRVPNFIELENARTAINDWNNQDVPDFENYTPRNNGTVTVNRNVQPAVDTPVWDDIFNETVIGERPAVSPRLGRLSDDYKLTIPDRIIRGGEITPPEYRADITNSYIDGNFDGEVSQDRQPETDTTGGGFNLKDPSIIAAGINMLGSLGSYLINRNTLNKTRPRPTSVKLSAQKLKTKYNINPQLDELREQAIANNRLIANNTASSRTALGRMNLINTALGRSRAELYGTKENRETELINQDILNSQSVGNQQNIYNAQLRADYQNRLDEFTKLRLANNNAFFSGLTGGINSIADSLLRQRYYNNTIGAIGARNPNVDARIFRDAGVDWSFMYPYSTRNRS